MTPRRLPFGATVGDRKLRPPGDVRPPRRDHPDDAAAAISEDRASDAERFEAAERMRDMSDDGSRPTDAQVDAHLDAGASRRGADVETLPVGDERRAAA